MTDEFGLTLPNSYLELFYPAYNSSIVLLVKYRHNPTYTLLNYGPLPTTTSSGFTVYNGVAGGAGGSANPAAAGTVPAAGWIKGIQFNVPSTFYVNGTFPWGNNDIWYTQVQSRLFEVRQFVTPAWMRIAVDIPTLQNQETFQDQVAGGVDQDFGWHRGSYYVVHTPNLHYGYDYGNDSNYEVYSRVEFRYAEQEVELVKDPNVVFGVIAGMIPAHRVPMPVISNNASLSGALTQTYGFDSKAGFGFPVFPADKKAQAVAEYAKLLAKNPAVQQGLI